MEERDLWKKCKELVCKTNITPLGFQHIDYKMELQKIYPYLTSYEIYNFLKYGYDKFYCKVCGEPITKYKETEFCCRECKEEYYRELYLFNKKFLWEDAKYFCTLYESSKGVRNKDRGANPLTILCKMEDVEPKYMFEYLRTGIDLQDVKPEQKTTVFANKTWEDVMGKERADERRKKLIERQTGKKHSEEWTQHMRDWYRKDNNRQLFKELNQRSPESREKQGETFKKNLLENTCSVCTKRRHEAHDAERRELLKKEKAKSNYIVLFDDIIFKSRYEVIYYVYSKYILKNDIYYEKVRVPYFDNKINTERVYVIDFINENTNELIEIKPKCFIKEMQQKIIGVDEYIKDTNLTFEIITEDKLKEYYFITMNNEEFKQNALFKSYKRVMRFYNWKK